MPFLPIRHRRKPNDSPSFYCIYPTDVGNLHVIDYYLHLILRDTCDPITPTTPADRFDPEDWSRYDGELL